MLKRAAVSRVFEKIGIGISPVSQDTGSPLFHSYQRILAKKKRNKMCVINRLALAICEHVLVLHRHGHASVLGSLYYLILLRSRRRTHDEAAAYQLLGESAYNTNL